MPPVESSNKRKATEMEDDASIKLEDGRGSQARLEKDAHILNGENDDMKSLAKQLTQLTTAVTQLTASNKQVQDYFQKVAKEQSKEISSLKDLIRELRETVTSLKSSQSAAQGSAKSGNFPRASAVSLPSVTSLPIDKADFNRCVSVLLSTIARKKGQTPERPVFLDMVSYGDLKANQGFTFSDIVNAAERSGKIERSASGILTIRMD
ncbi:hypothetical protein QFC24_000242 [Naganishia onofrii]|uniref:Uncharacterized protein n=1 Tax=Naganishia onofrii TaxID=1851511 RepID=A0ACC2XWF3_9TREE|nr:hypothetical protein QFC24_000242 [Naganishia onofrii]